MFNRKRLNGVFSILIIVSLLLGASGSAIAGPKSPPLPHQKQGRITQADRKAAAKNAKDAGLQVGTVAAGTLAAVPGGVPDYFGPYPNYANSPTNMRKFVDALPSLPIAVPDTTTYPGSDYYIIALQQYTAQMHADLPLTTLRGYVQLNASGTPVAPIQYLGPVIVAQRDRPVRVKFINQLPTGAGGDLFIPVDTTYMGAGMGPAAPAGAMGTDCQVTPKPTWCYSEDRATLHLHGGTTPWISDGTPHQWTTPAGENTSYPKGVSVQNVPDMDGGTEPAGTVTFFYSNQQSARLMFYHDHAYGITRLNVYAGEAAGYLLTDQVEQDLINGTNVSGANPGNLKLLPDVGMPLVIQDKTFVDQTKIAQQDPTWNGPLATGSLWFPHVYMPNQNPYDISGASAMGRWDYGPWFWPPFTGLINGPIPNPYCLPTPPASSTATTWDCSAAPWEPPFMLGTPNPSGVPEGFMDTPVVNGKAYPTLNVPAGLVRFRILNAANDRYWNLQLYQATPGIVSGITISPTGSGYTAPVVSITGGGGSGATALATVDPTTGAITGINLVTVGSGYTSAPTVNISDPTGTGALATAAIYTAPTEVGMMPASLTAGVAWPAGWTIQTANYTPDILDSRQGGVPDPALRGPAMIQIGTEGGFLPGPALLPNTPIGYEQNKRNIIVLNVKEHTLLLGPAERADVLVDFTKFAGKTLILYNDAPAALPAGDPRNDYYTGDLDQTSTGGAPTTQAGYGPNIRTIMQIVVGGTGGTAPVDDYNKATLSALQSALPLAFNKSQDTVIVPQAAYNAVYGTAIPDTIAQYVPLQNTTYSFTPIGSSQAVTAALQPKSIIEDFTPDYGRMNALIGVEIPHTNNVNQTSIMQAYIDPPTELVGVSSSKNIQVTTLGTFADGTQLWKITHNGVDTHAIHVHMFNAQLVNRVGWDGAIYPPEPNELGWKDTIRMNPLEDIIVALRPIQLTNVPFKLPNSVRPLDVTAPLGSATGFNNVDPNGNPITPGIVNQLVNFGWEYVWHCHLLGHEENDMMRPMVGAIPPEAPSNLVATLSGGAVKLTWKDNSLNETAFIVQRMNGTGVWTTLATLPAAAGSGTTVTYSDTSYKANGIPYSYRVLARDVVGSTQASGFTTSVAGAYATLNADSAFSNIVAPPAGTTTLAVSQAAAAKSPVVLNWTYTPSGDQTGFTIQRATNSSFSSGLTTFKVGANVTSYSDSGAKAGTAYWYRVMPTSFLGNGSWSNVVTITPHP